VVPVWNCATGTGGIVQVAANVYDAGDVAQPFVIATGWNPEFPAGCSGCGDYSYFGPGKTAYTPSHGTWSGGGALSVPSAPTNLSATQSGTNGDQILLKWNYGTDPIAGFNIYRKASFDATWSTTPIDVIPNSGPPYTYTDANLPFSYGTYSYRATAFDSQSESKPSDVRTAYQLKKVIYGPSIMAWFTPDPTESLIHNAAAELGYDHFNWISVINHNAACSATDPNSQLHNIKTVGGVPVEGDLQRAPYLDPPIDGYWEYLDWIRFVLGSPWTPFDDLPYYYDEKTYWALIPVVPLDSDFNILSNTFDQLQAVDYGGPFGPSVRFGDSPNLPCLPGTGSTDYEGFFTTLVGVPGPVGTTPTNPTALKSFSWYTTNGRGNGSVTSPAAIGVVPPIIAGNGQIFNVSDVALEDIPGPVKQLLLQSGVQGIPTSAISEHTPPITAAFVQGTSGANGWYSTPVTVTLIATDIDGAADIGATSYSIDGGSVQSYTAPFGVYSDGAHTIQFSSVDKAGNLEVAKTLTFKIDQTPPHIIGLRSPDPNAYDWNNSTVTITFQCSDAVSGLATGSPPPPTTVTTEGTRQSVKGTCTDLAGNSISLMVGDINIDTTPPVLNAVIVPPPNGKGWNNTATTVSFVANDPLSGVASVSSPVTVSSEGAGQIVTGSATDKAGNTSMIQTTLNIDMTPPTITVAASAPTLWPPNGKLVPDIFSGTMTDALSGIDPNSATFNVLDEYGVIQPSGPITVMPGGIYSFSVALEASRLGQDLDGRHYQVIVSVNDKAGKPTSVSTVVTVPHDQRR
jgi:hypothetical protein